MSTSFCDIPFQSNAYAEAHSKWMQQFEGKNRLRTTYVDSNGRRTYGVTYIEPEESDRIFSQNIGKKAVQRLTWKAHNRWSHPEFEYLRRKKR